MKKARVFIVLALVLWGGAAWGESWDDCRNRYLISHGENLTSDDYPWSHTAIDAMRKWCADNPPEKETRDDCTRRYMRHFKWRPDQGYMIEVMRNWCIENPPVPEKPKPFRWEVKWLQFTLQGRCLERDLKSEGGPCVNWQKGDDWINEELAKYPGWEMSGPWPLGHNKWDDADEIGIWLRREVCE